MAHNTHKPNTRAPVRHAVDCPGGPLCYCGVTGAPASTLRLVLPRPTQVVQLPHALPRGAQVLPKPLAKGRAS